MVFFYQYLQKLPHYTEKQGNSEHKSQNSFWEKKGDVSSEEQTENYKEFLFYFLV